jgi:tetratricopeptide (TPR) repeat protein
MENNNLSVNDTIMGKLRPSLKNRLISRKYNLNSDHSPNRNGEDSEIDLRNWGIEPILSNDAIFTNASIGQSFQAKWINAVKQRKQENLQLDISASGVFPNKFGDDCSVISENMEYINNFIEENYQMVLTENIFITNPDSYHSIIPFLLMESKTIHRMTLSDYEIKMVLRSFQKKEKTNRIDAMDYYKIGLINFYRGKYLIAYSNFKKAIKSRNKDVNLMKWLAFTCLIIVFCHGLGKSTQFNTKINFKHIKDVEILDQKEETDEEESFLFGCCVTRKKKVNLNMSYMNKTDNLSIVESDIRVNRCSLCKEVEELLKNAVTLDKEEKHLIELYWMYMIISVYNFLRPDQKVFAKEVSIQDMNTSTSSTSTSMKLDPKVFVKKIKDKDLYMGYLVYAEYNYLLNQEFNINTILEELVTKFPNKIEAYLKYWYSLVKGKERERDFKKAHQLSEIFWRNSSIINFDNNIY